MRIASILLIALAALLSGCASRVLENYAGSDATSIEFASSGNDRLTTAVYSDDLDCYGVKYVSVYEPVVTKPAVVKEKKFVTFEYQYFNMSGPMIAVCGGIYTVPSTDSKLRVVTQREGAICRVSVLRQASSGSSWVPADGVVARDKIVPASDSEGPHCRADARFQGSSLLPTPRKMAQ